MNLNEISIQHKFYILFIIATLFFKNESYSRALDIAGDISSDVTWSGIVYVSGDITVKNGATLTISKGCYVEIQGSFSINIEGRLLALGAKNDTIHFIPSDKVEGWQGFKFKNVPISNDTSKIQYCTIKYSKAGNSNIGSSGAG
ncbi:MAG: hypothetical protein M3421_05770, partial [Bacteroidota bacterium]|nr:hypothetical protein [Bacteroidota bacterium]